jgi:hypothetical protein
MTSRNEATIYAKQNGTTVEALLLTSVAALIGEPKLEYPTFDARARFF